MLAISAGMMQSGSTLTYNIVSGLVERLGRGRREGYFSILDWATYKDKLYGWARDYRWHVISTHDWLQFEKLAPERLRFFYVQRDILDVARSARRIWHSDIHAICQNIDISLDIRQRLTNDNRALMMRYKTLIELRRKSIISISEHLGFESTDADIQAVLVETNRQNMRRRSSFPTRGAIITLKYYLHKFGFTGLAGSALYQLGVRGKAYHGLRRMMRPHDRQTLLHRGHFGMEQMVALEDWEVDYLKSRYNLG